MHDTADPADVDAYHHAQRSVKWRSESDGMTTFTIRLPPVLAGILIAVLTSIVMRSRPKPTRSGEHASADWPTVAQQHAVALATLLDDGAGSIDTEFIVHVRGDGDTLDDGTPITDTAVASLITDAFLRALIHDAESRPVNASTRRRHPTTRQKRVVKERDRTCIDCGRHDLLQYDHNPPYEQTQRTHTAELQLRCAPCHHARHAAA